MYYLQQFNRHSNIIKGYRVVKNKNTGLHVVQQKYQLSQYEE